jgi:hypothetical protein
MEDPIPSELTSAIEALWRHGEPVTSNFYAAPAFAHLRETCERLYRSAGSKDAVNLPSPDGEVHGGCLMEIASHANVAEGPVMADLPGLILEASFDQGVPTWKVQRHNRKNALPDLVSSDTADSFGAAKAAARK